MSNITTFPGAGVWREQGVTLCKLYNKILDTESVIVGRSLEFGRTNHPKVIPQTLLSLIMLPRRIHRQILMPYWFNNGCFGE